MAGPFSETALDFPAIAGMLGQFISGPLTKLALDAIRPGTDRTEIEREIEAAREALGCLADAPRPSLSSVADPWPILDRLRVDSLPALEILALAALSRIACAWRELFVKTPFRRLDAIASSIPDLSALLKALDGKILPDGTLDSSSSPALARIRRSIDGTRRELQSRLERILHRLGQEQVLQEDLITLRNERYVLPVKAEKKRQVEGIVHGTSSTGLSVFVEPLETLPLNNELAELADREAAEVLRLLAEFSRRLRERLQDLSDAARSLAKLDLAFAKAEFAREYSACFPRFSETGRLVLRGARHPLLIRALRPGGKEAVPLSIELSPPHTMVVITGPNTGGKTVALKTVGTAVLMAQAAMPVVAGEAELPLFTRVLADIGDQQSIEQNLSTFSAHIRSIQAMAESADQHCLVLLDEIGGSTDPAEGAALAIAILEHFRTRGATVFVSTHQSRLKTYGAETPGAMNAAMDFDENTLEPTYKLVPGLPGKSSGIDIAARLGLDAGIVQKARRLLGSPETGLSALISALHAKSEELGAAIARAQERVHDLDLREVRLKQEMAAGREARLRELDKRMERTLRDYSEKWKSAIEEIRRTAEAAPKPGKALANAGRRGERLAREARDEWNLQVLETQNSPPAQENGPPPELGDHVKLPNLSSPGIVTSCFPNGDIEVEIGRVRMRVSQDGVQVLSRVGSGKKGFPAPSPTTKDAGTGAFETRRANANTEDTQNSAAAARAEINVIGLGSDEAREVVDKFLDSAFLSGERTVRIVHGHGKGILRRSLHEMFASHPHVESFRVAPRSEGSDGVTIVEIKRQG
ncbi:MAG: Smr/MutS family protein [Acidobacteriota bacterium]|nr:Smr/MutS family protein [Acidobacteriota bacterium]